MQVNRNTRVNQFKDIFINARPEIVWSKMISINQWPEWQQEVFLARIDAAPAENVPFELKIPGFAMQCIVKSVIPELEFGWVGKNFFYKYEFVWRLKPYREGTHLMVEASVHGMPTRFIGNKLKYRLKKMLIGWTIQLKNESEVQYEPVS